MLTVLNFKLRFLTLVSASCPYSAMSFFRFLHSYLCAWRTDSLEFIYIFQDLHSLFIYRKKITALSEMPRQCCSDLKYIECSWLTFYSPYSFASLAFARFAIFSIAISFYSDVRTVSTEILVFLIFYQIFFDFYIYSP